MTGPAGEVAAALRAVVAGPVTTGVPLGLSTSFRLGGPAAVAVEAACEQDLVATARIAAEAGLPVLALGRGSNVLVSDRGFPGVVLRLGKGFDWIRAGGGRGEPSGPGSQARGEPPGPGLQAGGAAPLGRLANFAARRGLTGLEFAVAIPASLGGAVRMNAGAHASSFAEVLDWVRLYRLGEAQPEVLPATALAMGYRSTGLEPSDIVCAARLRLAEAPPEEIAGRMQRYREHRAATQPAAARNAGSMFRNPDPPGLPAGRLIEEAGLKGFRIGGAEVSARHANFFLAREGARAQDVYRLLAEVQARVLAAAGVLLVPEIRLIGEFDGPPPAAGPPGTQRARAVLEGRRP
jgi:UDP-N-acetylmuramate dehydrogenase